MTILNLFKSQDSEINKALQQGKEFKRYQKRIAKSVNSHNKNFNNTNKVIEGFDTQPTHYAEKSKSVLDQNKLNATQILELQSLKQQYTILEGELSALQNSTSASDQTYLNIIDPNNKYHNKNIRFTGNGKTGYVTNQGDFKWYPTTEVFNSTAGKNGCPANVTSVNNAGADYNIPGTIIQANPPVIVGTSIQAGQSCGNEGNNVYVNSILPDSITPKYTGCYTDDLSAPTMTFIGGAPSPQSSITSAGSYTYSMCKEAAISSGYRYFSLQDVNSQTSTGYCAVSNNSVAATRNGTSYVVTGDISLWSSKTSGKNGSSAILTTEGALSVVQNNTSIFSTPNSKATPSNYLGCYGDNPNRAMALYNNGSQQYSYSQCETIAKQSGSKYFGLQDSSSGTNAQCALSNDLAQTIQYGKAGNCTTLSSGNYSGGGWSNAVYSVTSSSNYFLILQDDGNLCVYRGSGPNDIQGAIWCAMTNGKQQKPNPKYAASKGKYGKNYITSGSTLASGDFVGSTDGSIYLIMQNDGNLILYTSQNVVNCSKMVDNNMGGGVAANALYDLGTSGYPDNVGKIGYVDYDGNLSEYPSSMKGLATSYSLFRNSYSPGNDIGDPIRNTTALDCQQKCNTIDNCGGFVFDKENICHIKKVGATRDQLPVSDKDFYLRQPSITTAPGSTKQTATINSIQWQNYKNTGKPVSSSSFGKFNVMQSQELDQLTGRLNLLAQQITQKTNDLVKKNINVDDQLNANKGAFDKTAIDYHAITSLDESEQLNNINEIVKDTDIVTLQQNYRYIMWSILATGVVAISINVLKKIS